MRNIFLLCFFIVILFFGCEKEYSEVIDPGKNVPPVISNLQAPKSLLVPITDTLKVLLSVDVFDAEGKEDIEKVYFNTFKPDGSPSSGNPFLMYDDGNLLAHGDLTANDGTYSRIIILPPGTTKGIYRFDFQAMDKKGELSNIITHYIEVK